MPDTRPTARPLPGHPEAFRRVSAAVRALCPSGVFTLSAAALTEGDWNIRNLLRVDEAAGVVFVAATREPGPGARLGFHGAASAGRRAAGGLPLPARTAAVIRHAVPVSDPMR